VVPEAARQPPGRPIDPLPRHVCLRRLHHCARDHGRAWQGSAWSSC
jgi:hypothetical protein